MISCFVALGSNLDQPLAQVQRAIVELQQLPHSQLLTHSPWYQSKAVGPGAQPDYINGVAQLQTTLPPHDLLHALQAIEEAHLRKRELRWGARTLDLDLLLYADQCINSDELIVPHPRISERNFVLYPLFDIAPQLQFPSGERLKDMVNHCANTGLSLVSADSSPTMRH